MNKPPKLIAEVNYTDADNYHKTFVMPIPEGKEFKVTEDEEEDFTEITEFGISEKEWINRYLTTFPSGYDPETDHNRVVITEIRKPNANDLKELTKYE